MKLKVWTVFRHPGRGSSPARVSYCGSEAGAIKSFARQKTAIRQGSVLLMDHAGGIQDYHWHKKT